MIKFSVRLKQLRKDNKVSVGELADALNVSIRTVQRWEAEQRIPNADAIISIAKYFDVSSDYLLGLSDI